jgi:ABC-type spermidine/putrescine transport system permease subunit II
MKWAYLLCVVGMLLAPVFYIIYISFNEYGFGARIYAFTTEWYWIVLTDTILVQSLVWTVYLATATVATAVPLGLLAAKFYKQTRFKVPFVTLMLSPLFVPRRHHGFEHAGLFQAPCKCLRGAERCARR